MRKEDVKIGMKVKLVGDKKAIDGLNSYVYEVSGNTEGGSYNLRRYGNNGRKEYIYAFNCADFEPYEEPKEYKTIKVVAEESGKMDDLIKNWEVVKGEKLENGMLRINLGELSEKDAAYFKAIIAEEESYSEAKSKALKRHFENQNDWKISSEDMLPITQEFIEGFGFELVNAKSPAKKFVKTMKDKQAQLYWTNSGEFSMHIDEMLEERNAIFIGYTCTTQSELRFLLTKGRIDCSK